MRPPVANRLKGSRRWADEGRARRLRRHSPATGLETATPIRRLAAAFIIAGIAMMKPWSDDMRRSDRRG